MFLYFTTSFLALNSFLAFAKKIQALVRGELTRSKLQAENKYEAAKKIQDLLREKLTRTKLKTTD